MSVERKSAAIIGAGVAGVTTALELQAQGIQDITLYSEKLPSKTTSVLAGAVFEPYKPGTMPVEEMLEYVRVGLDRYGKIIDNHPESETGIRRHNLYSTSTEQIIPENIPFLPAMPSWQLVAPPAERYKSAILLESVPFIDPTIALPYLLAEFEKNGGQIKAPYSKIIDLESFVTEVPEEVIFNCSGLGARELLNDPEIKAVRGQIIVVNYVPSWDWSLLGDDGYYVFPRMRETILGGTVEEDVWEENTTPEDLRKIFEKAQEILPELKHDHISRTYAGLRPYRVSGVRVEATKIAGKTHVVNAGHGGSGWTFCWGTAQKAVNLALNSSPDELRNIQEAV